MSNSEWELIPMFKFGGSEDKDVLGELHAFTTCKGTIGLAPSDAREGDMIYQFWDSDVVAVVRFDVPHYFRIIGRAVVANEEYNGSDDSKFLAPMGRDTHMVTGLDFNEGGTDVYMDMRTLQLMTQ